MKSSRKVGRTSEDAVRVRNAFEYRILCVLLKEVRLAVRAQGPITITIDPWLNGERGAYVIATPPPTSERKYTVGETGDGG
jgi:hypothetical protein